MKTALIIGNGESRLKIKKMPSASTVIGCNAAYRNFACDAIVAVDKRMVEEIIKNSSSILWTKPENILHHFNNEKIKVLPTIPLNREGRAFEMRNWGTGPYALFLAAKNFNKVYVIGFDFYSKTPYVNNVYKGTENYSQRRASAVDPAFWIIQISAVIDYFNQTSFIFYKDSDLTFPNELLAKNNLTIVEV